MENDRLKLPVSYLFEGQFEHVLLLACLVPGAIFLASPALDGSSWLGIPDQTWFFASILTAIVHQVVGWFVFRFQLIFSLFSRLFSRHDLLAWGIIFFPLMLLRPILSLGLALADTGSLEPFRTLQVLAGVILLIPAIYTGWSIGRYFGISRALGGDHFRQEYRDMPLVREGAFRYSSNAMYTFVFLLFWSIALFTGSRAALASALFSTHISGFTCTAPKAPICASFTARVVESPHKLAFPRGLFNKACVTLSEGKSPNDSLRCFALLTRPRSVPPARELFEHRDTLLFILSLH